MLEELFKGMLAGAFSPECVRNEQETREAIAGAERYRDPELLERVAEVIRDEEMSWKTKADEYLAIHDPDLTEQEAQERFRYAWKMLTDGKKPFPLDE